MSFDRVESRKPYAPQNGVDQTQRIIKKYRRPKVRAVCPNDPTHRAKITSTQGKLRYARCLDCEADSEGNPVTWKILGPAANEDNEKCIDPNVPVVCPRNENHFAEPYKQVGNRFHCACNDCDVEPWVVTLTDDEMAELDRLQQEVSATNAKATQQRASERQRQAEQSTPKAKSDDGERTRRPQRGG